MEINDEIHGCIQLPSYITAIIKTPQFQRLQNIAQLGCMVLTSAKAQHTRYDHCIGTYHLATRMLHALELNSPWVSDDSHWDVICKAVVIAALLHDIGHGPFSHSWERVVDGFHHEENGIACVDAIFQQLPAELLPELRAHNAYGVEIVKALIVGDIERLPSTSPIVVHKFIFEIVNNKRCGLDVDKWDYLKRDGYHLSEECAVQLNFDDVFLNARISPNRSLIEYCSADFDKIYELYKSRYLLHLNCYRRPINVACEEILRKLVQRCEHTICGLRLSEIKSDNMVVFLQLNDTIVLKLLSDDVDFKYLRDCSNIEISEDSQQMMPEREAERSIETTIVIKGPGTEMPPDDQFCFYGDDRPIIKRNNSLTLRRIIFRLS